MYRRVKIFFDGGWRPSTGMETAVVVRGREYVRQGLGPGSSLEAEWLALIDAVRIAGVLGLEAPVFLGDSLAVIGRTKGTAHGKAAGTRQSRTVGALEPLPAELRVRHVKRSQNLAGIALARLHER